jgi:hypothetical protein
VRESQFQSLSLYCSVTHFDQTTMDDELRQVQEKIAATEKDLTRAEIEATKADLTEAERQRKLDLVLMYGNLLVRLYDKEARVEARLSAGEIYYNRGVCDILWFLPPMFMISYYPIFIYMSPS